MRRKITVILMVLALIFGMTYMASAAEPAEIPTYTIMISVVGTGTWTVPDGVTHIVVEMIGGGGGTAAPTKNNTGSGGGGGGGYSANTLYVALGDTFTYTVGAGGSDNGGDGGTTAFGPVVAGGGKGSTGTIGGAGGEGAVPPDINGIVRNSDGGNGADAVNENKFGGGSGGGGGGILGANADGNKGGLSPFGSGGAGGVKNAGESGANGTSVGSGAGGSFRKSNVFGNSGQTGAPGMIIIYCFISDVATPSTPAIQSTREDE